MEKHKYIIRTIKGIAVPFVLVKSETDAFCMMATPVTQELYEAVTGKNPSYFKGPQNPVEQVSWYDILMFIGQLVNLTGIWFRLPTEAEWEFAAKGGLQSKGYKYAGSNNLDEVGWYWKDNLTRHTHPVGQKSPNELGLYDMSGNVWEWCANISKDCYSLRGGSWNDLSFRCEIYSRLHNVDLKYLFYDRGFRLVY